MDSVILEYAICKWGDRETASYLPINSINEHQTVDGKTVNMIFDAWGRQLGVPTFNYPRPPYEEDLRPSDDVKYYRFDPDDEHKVVVYRMTGYTKVLPSGGNGGGGGGGSSSIVPLPSHIIDSTSTSAYIPVLSGGMIYEYTQPLAVLSIGEIQSSIQETDILFTAGAIVSLPASVNIKCQTGEEYDWNEVVGDIITPIYGHNFAMVSSGNGYAPCVIDAMEWYNFEGMDDIGYPASCYSVLSNGSFTCTSDGGKWTISAVGVSQYISNTIDRDEDSYIDERTEVFNTWIASSTDNMVTWTLNDAVTINVGWHSDMGGDDFLINTEFVVDAPLVIVPCDVALSSGATLVNSSAITIESGGRYEMNVKYGAIITAEWMEKSDE